MFTHCIVKSGTASSEVSRLSKSSRTKGKTFLSLPAGMSPTTTSAPAVGGKKGKAVAGAGAGGKDRPLMPRPSAAAGLLSSAQVGVVTCVTPDSVLGSPLSAG